MARRGSRPEATGSWLGRSRREAIALVSASALLLPVGGNCAGGPQVRTDGGNGADAYSEARAEMVRTQIRDRGVTSERVLRAMATVPRHLFVPRDMVGAAYEDHPLPIGYEQTISQPYIVALMTELLGLDGEEKVLEIGTGSGYQAAVLAELAAAVYSIEIVAPLAVSARARLESLGYDNVHVRAGDGYRGWPEEAPFDAVILTAAPPEIPEPLIAQLAPGGVLVAPVGDHYQELVLLEKTATGLERRRVAPVRFVPMTGEAQERR